MSALVPPVLPAQPAPAPAASVPEPEIERLTWSRGAYQQYKATTAAGQKLEVKGSQIVAHGSYPANKRQRRQTEWTAKVDGEDVGVSSTCAGARALAQEAAIKKTAPTKQAAGREKSYSWHSGRSQGLSDLAGAGPQFVLQTIRELKSILAKGAGPFGVPFAMPDGEGVNQDFVNGYASALGVDDTSNAARDTFDEIQKSRKGSRRRASMDVPGATSYAEAEEPNTAELEQLIEDYVRAIADGSQTVESSEFERDDFNEDGLYAARATDEAGGAVTEMLDMIESAIEPVLANMAPAYPDKFVAAWKDSGASWARALYLHDDAEVRNLLRPHFSATDADLIIQAASGAFNWKEWETACASAVLVTVYGLGTPGSDIDWCFDSLGGARYEAEQGESYFEYGYEIHRGDVPRWRFREAQENGSWSDISGDINDLVESEDGHPQPDTGDAVIAERDGAWDVYVKKFHSVPVPGQTYQRHLNFKLIEEGVRSEIEAKWVAINAKERGQYSDYVWKCKREPEGETDFEMIRDEEVEAELMTWREQHGRDDDSRQVDLFPQESARGDADTRPDVRREHGLRPGDYVIEDERTGSYGSGSSNMMEPYRVVLLSRSGDVEIGRAADNVAAGQLVLQHARSWGRPTAPTAWLFEHDQYERLRLDYPTPPKAEDTRYNRRPLDRVLATLRPLAEQYARWNVLGTSAGLPKRTPDQEALLRSLDAREHQAYEALIVQIENEVRRTQRHAPSGGGGRGPGFIEPEPESRTRYPTRVAPSAPRSLGLDVGDFPRRGGVHGTRVVGRRREKGACRGMRIVGASGIKDGDEYEVVHATNAFPNLKPGDLVTIDGSGKLPNGQAGRDYHVNGPHPLGTLPQRAPEYLVHERIKHSDWQPTFGIAVTEGDKFEVAMGDSFIGTSVGDEVTLTGKDFQSGARVKAVLRKARNGQSQPITLSLAGARDRIQKGDWLWMARHDPATGRFKQNFSEGDEFEVVRKYPKTSFNPGERVKIGSGLTVGGHFVTSGRTRTAELDLFIGRAIATGAWKRSAPQSAAGQRDPKPGDVYNISASSWQDTITVTLVDDDWVYWRSSKSADDEMRLRTFRHMIASGKATLMQPATLPQIGERYEVLSGSQVGADSRLRGKKLEIEITGFGVLHTGSSKTVDFILYADGKRWGATGLTQGAWMDEVADGLLRKLKHEGVVTYHVPIRDPDGSMVSDADLEGIETDASGELFSLLNMDHRFIRLCERIRVLFKSALEKAVGVPIEVHYAAEGELRGPWTTPEHAKDDEVVGRINVIATELWPDLIQQALTELKAKTPASAVSLDALAEAYARYAVFGGEPPRQTEAERAAIKAFDAKAKQAFEGKIWLAEQRLRSSRPSPGQRAPAQSPFMQMHDDVRTRYRPLVAPTTTRSQGLDVGDFPKRSGAIKKFERGRLYRVGRGVVDAQGAPVQATEVRAVKELGGYWFCYDTDDGTVYQIPDTQAASMHERRYRPILLPEPGAIYEIDGDGKHLEVTVTALLASPPAFRWKDRASGATDKMEMTEFERLTQANRIVHLGANGHLYPDYFGYKHYGGESYEVVTATADFPKGAIVSVIGPHAELPHPSGRPEDGYLVEVEHGGASRQTSVSYRVFDQAVESGQLVPDENSGRFKPGDRFESAGWTWPEGSLVTIFRTDYRHQDEDERDYSAGYMYETSAPSGIHYQGLIPRKLFEKAVDDGGLKPLPRATPRYKAGDQFIARHSDGTPIFKILRNNAVTDVKSAYELLWPLADGVADDVRHPFFKPEGEHELWTHEDFEQMVDEGAFEPLSPASSAPSAPVAPSPAAAPAASEDLVRQIALRDARARAIVPMETNDPRRSFTQEDWVRYRRIFEEERQRLPAIPPPTPWARRTLRTDLDAPEPEQTYYPPRMAPSRKAGMRVVGAGALSNAKVLWKGQHVSLVYTPAHIHEYGSDPARVGMVENRSVPKFIRGELAQIPTGRWRWLWAQLDPDDFDDPEDKETAGAEGPLDTSKVNVLIDKAKAWDIRFLREPHVDHDGSAGAPVIDFHSRERIGMRVVGADETLRLEHKLDVLVEDGALVTRAHDKGTASASAGLLDTKEKKFKLALSPLSPDAARVVELLARDPDYRLYTVVGSRGQTVEEYAATVTAHDHGGQTYRVLEHVLDVPLYYAIRASSLPRVEEHGLAPPGEAPLVFTALKAYAQVLADALAYRHGEEALVLKLDLSGLDPLRLVTADEKIGSDHFATLSHTSETIGWKDLVPPDRIEVDAHTRVAV